MKGTNMRLMLLVSTLMGTAVTCVYWLAFFAVAYGLTGGDYRPGSEPSVWQRNITVWAVWGSGFFGYAIIAWLWRSLDFWLVNRRAS